MLLWVYVLLSYFPLQAGAFSYGKECSVFEYVLTPMKAVLMDHVVTRIGHVYTVSRAVPAWDWGNLGKELVEGSRVPCLDEKRELHRCYFRAASEADYPLRGWLMTPERLMYSGSSAHPVLAAWASGSEVQGASIDDDVKVGVHDRVAANALTWRWGTFVSEQCTRSCKDCWHQNIVDLNWILRGLLTRVLHVVNIGCRGLAIDDPTHTLIQQHEGEITGVCVDRDAEQLAIAETFLQSLGPKAARFKTIKEELRPGSAARWGFSPSNDSTTVLKVDIDTTFDEVLVAEIIRASKRAGQKPPDVVIVEYESRIPPPYRFRCLHSGIGANLFCQPSLSYWVESLGEAGYYLYKVSERDLVFLHAQLALRAATRDDILLPLDEIACYLDIAMLRRKSDLRESLRWLEHDMSTQKAVGDALDDILRSWDPPVLAPQPSVPYGTRYRVSYELSHPAFDLGMQDAAAVQAPLQRLREGVTSA